MYRDKKTNVNPLEHLNKHCSWNASKGWFDWAVIYTMEWILTNEIQLH